MSGIFRAAFSAGKLTRTELSMRVTAQVESVWVRAYTRLVSGDYISPHITHENIVLVCSLAPVAFLTPEVTNPLGANYHQFLAAADTDVSGAPVNSYQQAFSIYERGYGNKQITYIHGAGSW